MNTDRPTRLRLPLLAASIGIVIACTGDAHVGCDPMLTCSLRPKRFAPTPGFDAGPQACDLSLQRCTAAQVSAGGRHTCVVTDAGSLLCWGDDTQAQRGPTLDQASMAHATDISQGVDVDASVYLETVSRVLEGAKRVAAGGSHTCALLHDGAIECWGRDVEGQVDGRTGVDKIVAPVRVDIAAASDIDAGASHSCAVVPDGVVCWGSSQYGQAGRAPSDEPFAPELIPGTQGAVEVACGVRHTCARLSSLAVVCWGELIDAQGSPYITPLATAVPNFEARSISAGAGHSCALTKDYGVACWGRNDSGQLGDGTSQASATPVTVSGFDLGAGQVAAGGGELDGQLVGHSCAIDRSSQVVCWGRGTEGQIGAGIGTDMEAPQVVLLARVFDANDQPSLSDVVQIDLGAFHSCALGSSGAVYCWGDDDDQQLGSMLGLDNNNNNNPNDMPAPLPGRAQRVRRFGNMR